MGTGPTGRSSSTPVSTSNIPSSSSMEEDKNSGVRTKGLRDPSAPLIDKSIRDRKIQAALQDINIDPVAVSIARLLKEQKDFNTQFKDTDAQQIIDKVVESNTIEPDEKRKFIDLIRARQGDIIEALRASPNDNSLKELLAKLGLDTTTSPDEDIRRILSLITNQYTKQHNITPTTARSGWDRSPKIDRGSPEKPDPTASQPNNKTKLPSMEQPDSYKNRKRAQSDTSPGQPEEPIPKKPRRKDPATHNKHSSSNTTTNSAHTKKSEDYDYTFHFEEELDDLSDYKEGYFYKVYNELLQAQEEYSENQEFSSHESSWIDKTEEYVEEFHDFSTDHITRMNEGLSNAKQKPRRSHGSKFHGSSEWFDKVENDLDQLEHSFQSHVNRVRNNFKSAREDLRDNPAPSKRNVHWIKKTEDEFTKFQESSSTHISDIHTSTERIRESGRSEKVNDHNSRTSRNTDTPRQRSSHRFREAEQRTRHFGDDIDQVREQSHQQSQRTRTRSNRQSERTIGRKENVFDLQTEISTLENELKRHENELKKNKKRINRLEEFMFEEASRFREPFSSSHTNSRSSGQEDHWSDDFENQYRHSHRTRRTETEQQDYHSDNSPPREPSYTTNIHSGSRRKRTSSDQHQSERRSNTPGARSYNTTYNTHIHGNTTPGEPGYGKHHHETHAHADLFNSQDGDHISTASSNVTNKGSKISSTIKNEGPQVSPTIKNEGPQVSPTIKNEGPQVNPTIKTEGPQVSPTIKNEGPQVNPTIRTEGPQVSPTIKNEGPQVSPTIKNEGPQVNPTIKTEGPQVSPTIKNEGPQVSPTIKTEGPQVSPTIKTEGPQVSPTIKNEGPQVSPTIKTEGPQVSPTIKTEGPQVSPTITSEGHTISPNISFNPQINVGDTSSNSEGNSLQKPNDIHIHLHGFPESRPQANPTSSTTHLAQTVGSHPSAEDISNPHHSTTDTTTLYGPAEEDEPQSSLTRTTKTTTRKNENSAALPYSEKSGKKTTKETFKAPDSSEGLAQTRSKTKNSTRRYNSPLTPDEAKKRRARKEIQEQLKARKSNAGEFYIEFEIEITGASSKQKQLEQALKAIETRLQATADKAALDFKKSGSKARSKEFERKMTSIISDSDNFDKEVKQHSENVETLINHFSSEFNDPFRSQKRQTTSNISRSQHSKTNNTEDLNKTTKGSKPNAHQPETSTKTVNHATVAPVETHDFSETTSTLKASDTPAYYDAVIDTPKHNHTSTAKETPSPKSHTSQKIISESTEFVSTTSASEPPEKHILPPPVITEEETLEKPLIPDSAVTEKSTHIVSDLDIKPHSFEEVTETIVEETKFDSAHVTDTQDTTGIVSSDTVVTHSTKTEESSRTVSTPSANTTPPKKTTEHIISKSDSTTDNNYHATLETSGDYSTLASLNPDTIEEIESLFREKDQAELTENAIAALQNKLDTIEGSKTPSTLQANQTGLSISVTMGDKEVSIMPANDNFNRLDKNTQTYIIREVLASLTSSKARQIKLRDINQKIEGHLTGDEIKALDKQRTRQLTLNFNLEPPKPRTEPVSKQPVTPAISTEPPTSTSTKKASKEGSTTLTTKQYLEILEEEANKLSTVQDAVNFWFKYKDKNMELAANVIYRATISWARNKKESEVSQLIGAIEGHIKSGQSSENEEALLKIYLERAKAVVRGIGEPEKLTITPIDLSKTIKGQQ